MNKLIIICLFLSQNLIAQVAISEDGSVADPSALLEIKSTTKGLLLPRIALPADVHIPTAGLVIYNQATNSPNFYDGSHWADLSPTPSFTLPYAGSSSSAIDLFKINQGGSGRAIYAKTGLSGSNLAFFSDDFAIVGEGNDKGGIFGLSNSKIAVEGISNTGTGVLGQSNSNAGVSGFSTSNYGVYAHSTSSFGVFGISESNAGVAGFSTNNSGGAFYNDSGTGAGLIAEKNHSYNSQIFSYNPIAEMEVRHHTFAAQQAWGNVGLRIFNMDANKGWTFYTDADGNLVLFNNNAFIGYFDPNDKGYHTSSDARQKANVIGMPSVLSKINLLNPKFYNYIHSEKSTMGFVAQEVEKVFPQLVSKALDGQEYSVNYNGFGVLAIKAIQELKEIIDKQQKQIDSLLKNK